MVNVTNNSPSRDYSHPDDQTTQTTETPGFKPFTNLLYFSVSLSHRRSTVLCETESVSDGQAEPAVFCTTSFPGPEVSVLR